MTDYWAQLCTEGQACLRGLRRHKNVPPSWPSARLTGPQWEECLIYCLSSFASSFVLSHVKWIFLTSRRFIASSSRGHHPAAQSQEGSWKYPPFVHLSSRPCAEHDHLKNMCGSISVCSCRGMWRSLSKSGLPCENPRWPPSDRGVNQSLQSFEETMLFQFLFGFKV